MNLTFSDIESDEDVAPRQQLRPGRLIGVNTVRQPMLNQQDHDLINRIFTEMSSTSNEIRPSQNSDTVSGMLLNDFASANFESADSTAEPDIHSPSRSLELLIEQRKAENSKSIESFIIDNSTIIEKQRITKLFNQIIQKHYEFLKNRGKSASIDTAKQLQGKYGFQSLDTEIIPTAEKLESELAATNHTSLIQTYKNQSQFILQKYRELSQQLIELEATLKNKVNKFNAIQKQITFLMTLEENDESRQLIDATEVYLKKYFANSNIETHYAKFIELHKYWTMIRELLYLQRTIPNENNTAPTCCVCLADPVSMALNPCGHTFCTRCRTQLSNTCPICRTRISGALKVYFT